MKIGTDVNINICRVEGYPVIEFKKRELIQKGILDKEYQVKITISNPCMWTDTGYPIPGTFRSDLYQINDSICFNTLIDIFNSYGENIKEFCDFKNCPIELENPTEYDFLVLVSVINGYSGFKTWRLDCY